MTDKKPAYSEDKIMKLKPHEHVRLRPGMYVGGTDKNALHYLFHEIFDNAIDEAVAGYCDNIWITLRPNNELSIRDNGQGIRVYITSHGENSLELLMTKVFTGSIPHPYKVKGGLHGVGITAVNALSAECTAEVARDGYLWRQTYKAGKPVTEVIQVRPLTEAESTGTCISIQPDFTIFEPNEFDYEILANRAREVAYMIPTLTVTLHDEREKTARENVFHFEDGLLGYIKYLNQAFPVIHDPFIAKLECSIWPHNRVEYTARVEIAFQYTDTMETNIVGYVNTVKTTGGSHTHHLPQLFLDLTNQRVAESFSIAEVLSGLTIIVSVWHPYPHFESQAIIKLINPEVQRIVAVAIEAVMSRNSHEFAPITPKLQANRQALQQANIKSDNSAIISHEG